SIVLVEAFLHHVYRAYPFLDREWILRAAADVPDDGPEDDAMVLYMVMAIGHTSLERSGKAPSAGTAGFTIAYAEILQRCTMSESIHSIQILILLALYSLFDPQGPSTWTIVGIVTRQAVSLGLTRPGLWEDGLTPQAVQLRRRLFWSIFVLDRMMAVSVGQSPGLTVEDSMIPLPTITVEEFATPERAEVAAVLQVSRHVIELRQLEARILSTVHLAGGGSPEEKAPFDCSMITAKLRLEIENWYSQGCLISQPELDNVRVHDTMGWLNARYYHLLLLLYYPCRFNARSNASGAFRIRSLLELVRKFLQYNRVLLGSRQLPLNRITLNRLVPACLVLLHCFVSDADLADLIRIQARVCIDILGSFPPQWRQAHHLVDLMQKLQEIITGHVIGTNDDSVQSLRLDMLSLLGDTLGRANCYQDIVGWE
ncbi:fungal specific transcription factor domain-containing protein, partial [Aspergillus aculeatinus CBS 121060]